MIKDCKYVFFIVWNVPAFNQTKFEKKSRPEIQSKSTPRFAKTSRKLNLTSVETENVTDLDLLKDKVGLESAVKPEKHIKPEGEQDSDIASKKLILEALGIKSQ